MFISLSRAAQLVRRTPSKCRSSRHGTELTTQLSSVTTQLDAASPAESLLQEISCCFARADSVGACLGPSEKRWQPCKTSGPENVWHVPILQDRALHSEGQEIPGHNKIYILPTMPCILTFSSCPMQFRTFGFKTKEGGKLRKNALCTVSNSNM